MANLERTIEDYIKCEDIINNAPATEERLENEKRLALSNGFNGVYFIDGAEAVYKATEAILIHRKNIEKTQETKQKSEGVILAHLELLDGSIIQYVQRGEHPQYYTTTYNFAIKEGKLVHNHMKEI